MVLGANPSSSAAARTRARVSSRSEPRPLRALDAVPTDTPARAATSTMPTRRRADVVDVDVGVVRASVRVPVWPVGESWGMARLPGRSGLTTAQCAVAARDPGRAEANLFLRD